MRLHPTRCLLILIASATLALAGCKKTPSSAAILWIMDEDMEASAQKWHDLMQSDLFKVPESRIKLLGPNSTVEIHDRSDLYTPLTEALLSSPENLENTGPTLLDTPWESALDQALESLKGQQNPNLILVLNSHGLRGTIALSSCAGTLHYEKIMTLLRAKIATLKDNKVPVPSVSLFVNACFSGSLIEQMSQAVQIQPFPSPITIFTSAPSNEVAYRDEELETLVTLSEIQKNHSASVLPQNNGSLGTFGTRAFLTFDGQNRNQAATFVGTKTIRYYPLSGSEISNLLSEMSVHDQSVTIGKIGYESLDLTTLELVHTLITSDAAISEDKLNAIGALKPRVDRDGYEENYKNESNAYFSDMSFLPFDQKRREMLADFSNSNELEDSVRIEALRYLVLEPDQDASLHMVTNQTLYDLWKSYDPTNEAGTPLKGGMAIKLSNALSHRLYSFTPELILDLRDLALSGEIVGRKAFVFLALAQNINDHIPSTRPNDIQNGLPGPRGSHPDLETLNAQLNQVALNLLTDDPHTYNSDDDRELTAVMYFLAFTKFYQWNTNAAELEPHLQKYTLLQMRRLYGNLPADVRDERSNIYARLFVATKPYIAELPSDIQSVLSNDLLTLILRSSVTNDTLTKYGISSFPNPEWSIDFNE